MDVKDTAYSALQMDAFLYSIIIFASILIICIVAK